MGFYMAFRRTLNMIKVEHTLFGLPMALSGMLLAQRGLPSLSLLLWIIIAFSSLRAAAMTFNRIVDRKIDKLNPRTSQRELPSKKLSLGFALGFWAISSMFFFISAYQINHICFKLSPIAYVLLMAYSFTKRFTSLSHYILGLCLGLAPVAGYLAVKGAVDKEVIFLGLFVLLWVAGFDIVYACQDYEFDRTYGLFSLPADIGIDNSLKIAKLVHLFAFIMLPLVGYKAGLKPSFYLFCLIPGFLLFWEHHLLSRHGLCKIEMAFFKINSWVSVAVLFAIIAGL